MLFKRFAMTAVVALAAAGFASAAHADFTLENSTGYTIEQVYVSPTSANRWGDDVMDADVLVDSDSVDITFDNDETHCKWDVKVIYDDGEEAVWKGFNFCEVTYINLQYDHSSGRTWATYE